LSMILGEKTVKIGLAQDELVKRAKAWAKRNGRPTIITYLEDGTIRVEVGKPSPLHLLRTKL